MHLNKKGAIIFFLDLPLNILASPNKGNDESANLIINAQFPDDGDILTGWEMFEDQN